MYIYTEHIYVMYVFLLLYAINYEPSTDGDK